MIGLGLGALYTVKINVCTHSRPTHNFNTFIDCRPLPLLKMNEQNRFEKQGKFIIVELYGPYLTYVVTQLIMCLTCVTLPFLNFMHFTMRDVPFFFFFFFGGGGGVNITEVVNTVSDLLMKFYR